MTNPNNRRLDMDDFQDREWALIKRWAIISASIVAFLAALSIFFSAWYTVNQGERAVLLRVGAVSDIAGPGLHFKLPWIESIERVSTRSTWIEWTGKSAMEAYSRDQQPAHLSVKVTYHVLPDNKSVEELYTQYRTRDTFQGAVLLPRVLEGVKTTFGQYNAVTVIQDRAKFNSDVERTVRALVKGPIMIEGVQVQDISFSDAYEKAVEARMTAQVEIDRYTMNLERERKQAEIKVVQAEAEQKRLEAIGKGQAAAINLRGEALREQPAARRVDHRGALERHLADDDGARRRRPDARHAVGEEVTPKKKAPPVKAGPSFGGGKRGRIRPHQKATDQGTASQQLSGSHHRRPQSS